MSTENAIKGVRIGVIGGSGLYDFDHLKIIQKIFPETVSICLQFFDFFFSQAQSFKISFYSSHGVIPVVKS